jgi:signal transduction histidine kinase
VAPESIHEFSDEYPRSETVCDRLEYHRYGPRPAGIQWAALQRNTGGWSYIRGVKLSTRLLLPLLAAVALVMTGFAAWAVRQREDTLTEQSRRETNAYAVALGLAIESAYRDPTPKDIQEFIDRISRERTIYGVLVYGREAELTYVSDPLDARAKAATEAVRAVILSGEPTTIDRSIGGQAVYSVIRPIRDPLGKVVGAFEVAQPLSFLAAEIRQTRQRFLLNTLTLLVAVTILILVLVRQLVSRPLSGFVTAAQALGRGELEHRIEGPGGGVELAELAGEFNRMAARLEAARHELVHEADGRLDLERRLRETEKLAAIGNLAAGLAHEVAAPLHVIRGRAEMLLKRTTVEPDRRNLHIIVQQIGRITVIVRNLLDYARRREPEFGPVDLGAVIGGVLEFLDWEMGRANVQVTWDGTRELEIMGDADLLNQVFINLLMNAVQALELAGENDRRRAITIRTRVEDGTDGDAGVIVEVEDNGPGIPAEVLPRIFEPFVTTKANGGGTGLGLAVARSIIEEHHGRLVVSGPADPTAGSGAVFRIRLPSARTAVHV